MTLQRPHDDTELQELRAKIRVLEAKRTDDARHIRELETQLEDAKSFISVKPKLQAKLNQLQTELIATKRDFSDAQQLSQLAESRVLDAQEQLEMAMLDKEMAEEKADGMESELEELREKLAVAQVEMGVLKGEDGEFLVFSLLDKFEFCLCRCAWWC
jgi:dynactin 1